MATRRSRATATRSSQGAHTPPPYNLSPQPATTASPVGPSGSGGGKRRNMPVIVGSIVVALIAIGGLITALSLSGGGDDGKEASEEKSKTPVAGHKGPDRTRTIEVEQCKEPETAYNDETKVKVPDFTFKDWKSVLSCLQAAGWQYDPRRINENAYGEDTVMRQLPKEGSDIDPKNPPKFQLDISTGNPA